MEPRDENMHGLWMWQFSMHRSKFNKGADLQPAALFKKDSGLGAVMGISRNFSEPFFSFFLPLCDYFRLLQKCFKPNFQ